MKFFNNRLHRQILAGLGLLISPLLIQAQAISGIITDYNGFWKTSSTSLSAIKPDNSHNLLAFTYNGKQYSTGVNDALLSSRGETYIPGDFWALPVAQITGTINNNTKAGFGALYDGVYNGPGVQPPAYGVSMYLTDGIKGLNIGTCIANLPSGNLHFSISNIQASSIGDGIPDIVVTQIADPSGSSDRYEFTDENGVRIGNFKDIVFTHIPPVANWTADFYEAKVNPLQLTNGYTQTDRPMRLWSADLSEFGLTAANIHLVRNFKINLSGQSDVAFVAYNNTSVSFRNALPVQYSLFKGQVINNQVKLIWQTVSEQDADKFIVERSIDGTNFKEIGVVKAKNKAITVNDYSFTDLSPAAGKNYYRLKQVDLDGSYNNKSTVVSITAGKEHKNLQVFPNPAKGNVFVDHLEAGERDLISIYNAAGNLVKQVKSAKGTVQTRVDISTLKAGAYYLAYQDEEKKSSVSFVVQ